MKNVTIIGGGTGTYAVTSGLKGADLNLTKIVAVFDSGGSTRRLMDEFGFLPVGDLRQSLAALAVENHQAWIRDLLLYRFSKGQGLEGHNLGNLILTALQDMTGSTSKALDVASKIFRLKGSIYPITTAKSDLKIIYNDGSIEIGEHRLDEISKGGRKIKKILLTKPCQIFSKAKNSLLSSDFIIIGPGDLYASLLPNLIVSGARTAINKSTAKIIYIVNLMTRYTQTHDYTANDHINEIERYLDRRVDFVLLNTGKINPKIRKIYAKYQEFPVIDDTISNRDKRIIRGDFASQVAVKKMPGDKLPRALIRHDQDKITKALLKIFG